MNQKTISRNDLLLSGSESEEFFDEVQRVDYLIEVKSVWDWPEGCFIEFGREGSRQEFSFFLRSKDAERFAQAVLVHSGARKVVD